MIFRTIEFESFDQFFNEIIICESSVRVMSPKNGFIFRGESSNKYLLVPSALRSANKDYFCSSGDFDRLGDGSYVQRIDLEKSQVEAEYIILKDFFAFADANGLPVPNVDLIRRNFGNDIWEHLIQMTSDDTSKHKWLSYDMVELAALAQHYGVYTRMIDWTFDIFVALYFAAKGARKRELMQKESIENDMLVIWALNFAELRFLSNFGRFPLKFVVPPYNNNPNLCVQKGILTYWEITVDHSWTVRSGGAVTSNSAITNREPLDKLLASFSGEKSSSPVLYKFEFPAKTWSSIFNCIQKFGYSTSKLFPGFAGVANEINETYFNKY